MRTRTLLRGGLAAGLAALVMSTVQSSQADEPEWYPGLPDATFGTWASAAQGGISYAKRAKQWFRSPMGMTVAENYFFQAPIVPGSGIANNWIRAEGYFVSPTGAPDNYGYMDPMTVRSVGFGMVPVEATVQVSQRRANGYPIPVKVHLPVKYIRTPHPDGGLARLDQEFESAVITDSFNVRILSVRVDGVDLGLDGDCRTVKPAPVTMRGPAFTIPDIGPGRTNENADEWFRTADPSLFFNPIKGGELTGSMTIPAFTGCTTKSGDDLSDLLTLSASGPDNPVSARVGWPCAFEKDGGVPPAPPGASNPKAGSEAGGRSDGMDGCAGTKPFDYPEREDR